MKKLICIAVLGLALAGTAAAGDFDYVQVGYTTSHVQSRSGDSWGVSASKSLGQRLYVQGGFTDGLGGTLQAGTATVGVGLHAPLIVKNAEIYAQVNASAAVVNRASPSKYDYSAESGVRLHVTNALELRGGVVASNLRSATLNQIDWRGFGGAEYALTKNVRVGLTVSGKANDVDGTASVRLYF